MRSIAILLAGVLVLAAVPAQAADGRAAKPQFMERLVGALLERAGANLSGDENELKPTVVDGKGNTVFNIGELVINVGDVSLEKGREGGGTGMEGAERLVDLLMQRLDDRDKFRDQQRRERPGLAVIPTPYSHQPFGNENMPSIQTNSGWDQMYRQQSRGEQHQEQEREGEAAEHPQQPWMRWHEGLPGDGGWKDMPAPPESDEAWGPKGREGRMMHQGWKPNDRDGNREARGDRRADQPRRARARGQRGMRGGFWGPRAAGTVEGRGHQGQQAWGMPGRMRPDVDPEFMGLMMQVGRLARTHPQFRKALKKMVRKAEARAAAGAGAGHPGHGKRAMRGKRGMQGKHMKQAKRGKQGKHMKQAKRGKQGKRAGHGKRGKRGMHRKAAG